MTKTVTETRLTLPNKRQGKVRDLYDVTLANGDPGLLIVATDRISAFDVVLENGLPGKGVVLTQISRFWFDYFGERVNHHLVSTDVADVPGLTDEEREQIEGRIMLCRRTSVLPVECIVRGYITGSGYKDYMRSGKVCGIDLPSGLKNSDRLSEPLFTPSTKAEAGLHDENISFEEGVEIVGRETMSWLRDTTLDLYKTASAHARDCGIILADTKFEFGVIEGEEEPLLIDEIFTPDSSRFWPAEEWEPGREQNSFDKQIVRNYLETVVSAGTWDKTPPGPELPENVVDAASRRYLEAYELLTGSSLALPA
ncbi:MAG: phosphoribosylaminoimidazolesuccinocarboxamide synthase [Gammaproteobacteria bacterium]|nr:phosphoribosylaminoimidazolesuccinocarboxamide synthase [Gammaproteobacteria bacterium]MYD80672.1 phosphoribosylaminoimidazolesuccinocarboxamide synthase [Gammaproteobacteria bacterium]